MAWSRASDLIALAVAAFAAAALPAAADDPPTQFSRQITALTGDWQAEDWRNGTIKTHPDKYTWQSDVHLTLLPKNPPRDAPRWKSRARISTAFRWMTIRLTQPSST